VEKLKGHSLSHGNSAPDHREKPWTRLPRLNLNRALTETFDERQIYRIDHYLGKETIQNIIFPFAKRSIRKALEQPVCRSCPDRAETWH